jgi:riboflavin transporter FmnP
MRETDWQFCRSASSSIDFGDFSFATLGQHGRNEHMANETKSSTETGKERRYGTRKLTTMGMLAALGVVLVALIHFPLFPAAPFLEYDPADIAILIGTMIFGPLAGFLLTVLVSLLQAVLLSAGSGWIGFVMHVAATGAMVVVAGNLFKHSKRHSKSMAGAALSLAIGALTMTAVMAGMNLLLTPIFMGTPIDAVLEMMVPIIIPFNLIKAGINCLATFIIYKPIQKLVA